jgi:HD-GYP domain-containing protein (c-di-GMP phosphodiesterase class II)
MLLTDKGREDKELINSMATVIKTVQIHSFDNVAVTNALKKLLNVLNTLLTEGTVNLDLIGEFFHLNGTRIRYSTDSMLNYNFLVNEFKMRQLGSVIFKDTLHEDDVRTFLKALITASSSNSPFEVLSEHLKENKKIDILRLRKPKEGEELDRKKIVKKAYLNAVTLTKNISRQIASGEKINLKKAKRVMEVIVDQILEEEPTLIGMTTIKDYDEYTYFHSVNVSILSLALGQRLGLSKKVLTELGLAALFHDIGKIDVPKEILNKPTDFTEKDWEIIHKHPAWGVCNILKIKGVDPFSITAAITAFEHHLNYDLSGYPKIKNKIQLDLFSKIIAIADNYDAMTSSRVYARIPLSPEKALSVLLEKSGSVLDPYLVKIFVNMIGIYPIGTLVMLDTQELGLVFENNPNPDFYDRPRVYIVIDSKGNRTKQTVDLMERDENGNFKRNIVKTLDPNQYNISLAEFLL